MRPFVCVWAKAEEERNKTAIIEVAFLTIISFQPEKKGAQLLGAQASRLHSVRQHAQMIRYSSTPNDSAALFSRYALTAGGTPALPAVRSFARETMRCRKASHWALRTSLLSRDCFRCTRSSSRNGRDCG